MSCAHERIKQYSNVYARTDWEQMEDGSYMPDCGEIGLSKVISEDTERFVCADCGTEMQDVTESDGTVEGASFKAVE